MKLNPAFTGLIPEDVLAIFSDVLQIPRPSRKEDAMIAYITAWADRKGYRYKQDQWKNLVVFVDDATEGLQLAPVICYQVHTDSVCVNEAQWPIQVAVKDGWVVTTGDSTLTADNGLELSELLALCEKPHGRMELLFTANEELDFEGCEKFDKAFFGMQSDFLINLDTPHQGRIVYASAGFVYGHSRLNLKRESSNAGTYYQLRLSRMPGGHSGEDVNQFRGNALKLMGNIISQLPSGSRIVTMSGGEQGNSIPKACTAIVLLPAGSDDFGALHSMVENERDTLRCGKITFKTKPIVCTTMPLTTKCHEQVLGLLRSVPNGVEITDDVSGVAELSSTPSLIKIAEDGDSLLFTHQIRGATERLIDRKLRQIKRIYTSHGCKFTLGHRGQSWLQDISHPIVKAIQLAFEKTGHPGVLFKNHGAIEPGALMGTDPSKPQFKAAVSFGVWKRDEHMATERFPLFALQQHWAILQWIAANQNSLGL